MITQEDWNNWWSSPVAREFKSMMKEDLDKLAHGVMTMVDDQISTAIQSGRYQRTNEILNLTFEDITGNSDEYNRDKAS